MTTSLIIIKHSMFQRSNAFEANNDDEDEEEAKGMVLTFIDS